MKTNENSKNNKVAITGEVVSDLEFSNCTHGENFYLLKVMVNRPSLRNDMLSVLVSEKLIDIRKDYKGKTVEISGQFRSFNRHEDGKHRLILYVLAKKMTVIEDESEIVANNEISIEGFVCKEPIFRKTPLGKKITDLLIAVNRNFGRSDYIPCIAWGADAIFANDFNIGDKVKFSGRIQSREYQKKVAEESTETRTAYEVSIASFAKDMA